MRTMQRIRFAKRTRLGRFLCRLLGDQCGAVAMEYVVIALLVAAAVVGIVIVFGSRIANMFTQSTKALGTTESGMEQLAGEVKESREKDVQRVEKMSKQGDTIRGSDENAGASE
ncbi:MAG TPA: hypothetical protein PLE92_04590 [Lentisphaeria bacterium]|nr:hypothetical protein [Lentisphaerota bacterium]OQC12281.1 MAG: Flp/Fap pilin component [Lentisphaerae bacterium ADurb.Bin082]HQC52387.1 hypothetical protein [Lentisphaeria bacterium]HQL86329.1 hypothetical protein [Lentisphaeria bacterium]